MGIRRHLGLQTQADSSWIENVPQRAPQREVCPERETVVDRTSPNAGLPLCTSRPNKILTSLADSIPRVHRGRPWHGRSYPSPPQEFPPHGVFTYPATLYHLRLLTRIFYQRRDSGWIHTLLEEAENERMHLMFVADSFFFLSSVITAELVQDVPDIAESRDTPPGACPCRARRFL
jgi:hypothetical protein